MTELADKLNLGGGGGGGPGGEGTNRCPYPFNFDQDGNNFHNFSVKIGQNRKINIPDG